jgi:hypothetical protein
MFRGGDPKKVVESQQKRYASADVVKQVQDLWQDAYESVYVVKALGKRF